MSLRQFRSLDPVDQAEARALEEVLSKMKAWEDYQEEIEMDKITRKNKRR